MPDEPRESVMRATFRALREHGYANLTMQDIADETDLSKATLHYHYDTKRDLLTAFLDTLASWYEGRLEDLDGETPPERLASLFDECLSCETERPDRSDGTADPAEFGETADPEDHGETAYPGFHTAMLEVKAQAPHEAAYRDRLAAVDDVLTGRLSEIVAEGVEDGSLREVDPDAVAAFLADVLAGSHTRNVAVGRSLAGTRALLDAYVADHLLADPDPGRSDEEDRDRDGDEHGEDGDENGDDSDPETATDPPPRPPGASG
jgi:AcrR family transcriptional regulator